MRYLKYLFIIIFILALSLIGLVYAVHLSPPENINTPQTIPATGTIEIGFSPNGGITQMIVQELDGAKKSIEVQAYSFTSAKIAQALVAANRRGVRVRIILDKSQQTEKYSSFTFLLNAGIPVHVDRDFEIAHSKIMIVDRTDVITGSFNFTKSAEENNAENCLILRGNQPLAAIYEANWQWRWENTDNYR